MNTFITTLIAILICVLLAFLIIKWFKNLYKKGLLFNPKMKLCYFKKRGFVLGKYLFGKVIIPDNKKTEEIVMAIGGSGSAKTSAVLIPSIKNLIENQKSNSTILCLDISNDIEKNIDCNNKLVFDIYDSNTPPFSPFSMIDELPTIEEKYEHLEKMSYFLLPNKNTVSESTGEYFLTGARKLLCGCLIYGYENLNYDFCSIMQLIMSNDYGTLLNKIYQSNNKQAIYFISGFEGNSEKNIAGIKDRLDNAITVFATNKAVFNAVHRPNKSEKYITPAMLENGYNIFLKIPEANLETLAILMRLMVAQFYDFFTRRIIDKQSNNIYFFLDEFPRIGSIDGCLNAIRTLRKRKIIQVFALQSLTDLELTYHTEYKSMLDSVSTCIILNITNPDNAEYFIKKSDRDITVSDLSRLKKKLIVFTKEGYIYLRKNYYFKRFF